MRGVRAAHRAGREIRRRGCSELCDAWPKPDFSIARGDNWHWVQEAYPADTVSLRSVTSDNFVIIHSSVEDDGNTTGGKKGAPEVIGEVDFSSALTTVHPKAIYLHQGQQYHVDRLDFDQRKAYVRRVNIDYYTTRSATRRSASSKSPRKSASLAFAPPSSRSSAHLVIPSGRS